MTFGKTIIKIPGRPEEMDIHCPRCNSHDVLINFDPSCGYFNVVKCYSCGYTANRLDYLNVNH